MTDGLFKLNIDGKETCLKFSMLQMERMNELNAQRPNSISWAKVALIYSGLETYHRHAKIENPFTIEEVELWADELTTTEEGNALLEKINLAFSESVVFKKLISDLAQLDDKKKSNGKMLEPSHSGNSD